METGWGGRNKFLPNCPPVRSLESGMTEECRNVYALFIMFRETSPNVYDKSCVVKSYNPSSQQFSTSPGCYSSSHPFPSSCRHRCFVDHSCPSTHINTEISYHFVWNSMGVMVNPLKMVHPLLLLRKRFVSLR